MATGPISFRFTEEDILAANDLWRRAQIRPRRLAIVAGGLWLFYAGIMVLIDHETPHDIRWAATFSAALVLAVVVIMLLFGRWRSPRLSLKYFRDSRSAQQETHVSWTESHLRLEQSDSYQNFLWTDARQWAENDNVLVLLQTGPLFRALPKRVIDEAQLAEVRAHLASAGVPRAKLFFF